MYTDISDPREVAYIMTYVANDLMGNAASFEKEMLTSMKEEVHKKVEEEEKENGGNNE
jgi:hypothetical protein